MAANSETYPVHVRWMIRRHMPEVLDIEQRCFEFPWNEDEFIRALRQRNCMGQVAEVDDRVVGYVVREFHKTRFHIVNLAVHPDWQRRGIGKSIVDKVVSGLGSRRTKLLLEVRETNVEAQKFFRAIGFKCVSILHRFYEDTHDDAYLFQLSLDPVETKPKDVPR